MLSTGPMGQSLGKQQEGKSKIPTPLILRILGTSCVNGVRLASAHSLNDDCQEPDTQPYGTQVTHYFMNKFTCSRSTVSVTLHVNPM